MPHAVGALVQSEPEIAGLALALAGRAMVGLSNAERRIARGGVRVPPGIVRAARSEIEAGKDPLGDALCAVRSREMRRGLGAVYTPPGLVRAMSEWSRGRAVARVVDPGAGSGRFVREAVRVHPRAEAVAVEADPLSALILRATLEVLGLGKRASVLVGDYRGVRLGEVKGATLFIGNPPYVRHHGIAPIWKRWLGRTAARYGFGASRLAGLHAHFLLATVEKARPGDLVVFVTSAEWLDVNYGRLVRDLFVGPLGGRELHLFDPKLRPFENADTTAVIACCEVGAARASVSVRRISSQADLAPLSGGRQVALPRFDPAARWTALFRATKSHSRRLVELGEVCRVHRGQVTGANAVWISGGHSRDLPESVLFPAVTRARELFERGAQLDDVVGLRSVIDLPIELDELPLGERRRVERFLATARRMGAHRGFIAEHRRAWWSVGLRAPAPILATYMARRPPAFVRNVAGARHINIAHGLYPRDPMPAASLHALARYLSRSVSLAEGRTYAGGLTKFEPKEMERLLVPKPDELEA